MASDTDALQLLHGLTNVIQTHVVRDTRSADAWCHNEPHFSAFEFFIELQCVEDFFAREIFRQCRRQLELPEKIEYVELSGRSDFNDSFVSVLKFPELEEVA